MWFAAKLLFESSVRDDDDRVLQEESIRLIQADDETQAHAKASELGAAQEHQYPNERGEKVHWRFVGVVEVQDLCEDSISDGTEVYSTLKWRSVAAVLNEPPALAGENVAHGQEWSLGLLKPIDS
jgi:hypothetical protein